MGGRDCCIDLALNLVWLHSSYSIKICTMLQTYISSYICMPIMCVCVCVCVESGVWVNLIQVVLSYMRQLYSFLLFVYFSKKVVPPWLNYILFVNMTVRVLLPVEQLMTPYDFLWRTKMVWYSIISLHLFHYMLLFIDINTDNAALSSLFLEWI